MCLFDQVDDSRERRVPPQLGHTDVERAAAVDGAREHLIARRLVDRKRFAGDRRLIDGAQAGDDLSVEWQLFAWLDDDHCARPDLIHGHESLAGSVAHERLGRREIHQRAHGGSGAFERSGFECLCQREQTHDRGRFGPLPERHRSGRGHEHQDVDVERAEPQGVPRLP